MTRQERAELDLLLQTRRYSPKGAAAELQRSEVPEVVISGPAGTGKSRACLEKLHWLARRYAGSRYLIVRKTRESLSESGLFTFEQFVLGADHPLIGTTPRPRRAMYHYPNGSTIVTGGMDKASKIMSTQYDAVYVQEAIELSEDDWEHLNTRLRNGVAPYQQLVADTNPDRPTHWLKRRCDSGRALLLDSRHEDNPLLWDAELGDWTEGGLAYLARLDALTGPRYWRLRHGRWVQAEGVVYEEWDVARHVIAPFAIPAEWRRFLAVDFGYTNPFVAQWWALDGDGRMYLYRELYQTKRTVRAHAERIRELSQGERIEGAVCDHDAEDRATLEENGIGTVPAEKAILFGIGRVKERLKVAGDGRPRLYVLRGALAQRDPGLEEAHKPLCTEQELDGYVWSDRAKKELPLAVDDHGCDALRYAVMYADRGRGSGGIWV